MNEESRPLLFSTKRGDDPEYIDWQHVKVAYDHICAEYKRSHAFREMRDLLAPMKGKIDRIVTMGLGRPYAGDKQVFAQMVMMAHARAILGGKQVKLVQSDYTVFRDDENGEAFWRIIGMDTIDYDLDAHDADPRPISFTRRVRGVDYPGWDTVSQRSVVEYLVPEVTEKTLLFLPNVPYSPALRLIGATKPAMIISNGLSFFWRGTFFDSHGHNVGPEAQAFRQQWKKEKKCYRSLRDKYFRHELDLVMPFLEHGMRFTAYVAHEGGWPLSHPWDSWTTGPKGLILNIEDAEEDLENDCIG